MRQGVWFILLAIALIAGCAHEAAEEMAKVQVGMTPKQVEAKLGQPEAVKRVRFPGHQRDYLVLQYELIPQSQVCLSEGTGRVLTGMFTLGLSEVAWTNAKATPHWVYFLDNKMVYFSEAVDCEKTGCRTWLDIRDKNYTR
ncbi:MAG: hypothetical protein KQH53_05000 [Desulfarculaceae bacterium]|nr:hypothetical protein [Desulfarculaceae bacterium]